MQPVTIPRCSRAATAAALAILVFLPLSSERLSVRTLTTAGWFAINWSAKRRTRLRLVLHRGRARAIRRLCRRDVRPA
jgi:hypothetical protein